MKMRNVCVLLVLSIMTGCASDQRFPVLKGDYLGQAPPGGQAQIFAPGIVSTNLAARDVAMMPDGKELYFGMTTNDYKNAAILVTRCVDDRWTEPEVTPFSANLDWLDFEPCISPDGRKFYFLSNRPDSANGETQKGDQDIWVMDRVGNGWSEPYNLGEPVNSADEEYFPSVTNDGTIYFTRQVKGSPIGNIYRSRLANGHYSDPEKLPEQVNSGRSQFNAFIAPDESYIIVPVLGREDSFGATDYYIVFRSEDDSWSEPINMGEKINTAGGREYSPYVSRDGKYFFFMSDKKSAQDIIPEKMNYRYLQELQRRPQMGNSDIFWIETKIITELKNE